MIDLSTTYLGLRLRNPLVVSSCPLGAEVSNLRKMEDCGAAAVVLPSLFEEQLTRESLDMDRVLGPGEGVSAEAQTFFPDLPRFALGPEAYLEHVRRAKAALTIPVIGSLNGVSPGGWLRYARAIEQAGADALELNVYCVPTATEVGGAAVEQQCLDLVRAVRASVRLPVAVKLSPFYSAPAALARALDEVGVEGLVLFNRFYQPDFDLEHLEVVPDLAYSTSEELRLRLRWVAILYGRVRADLAVTGGVHTGEDVVKAMMAGAKVAMTASALLANGIRHLETLRSCLLCWMEEHEYASITQMQGSMSQQAVADPAAFERANYMKVLHSYALRRLSIAV